MSPGHRNTEPSTLSVTSYCGAFTQRDSSPYCPDVNTRAAARSGDQPKHPDPLPRSPSPPGPLSAATPLARPFQRGDVRETRGPSQMSTNIKLQAGVKPLSPVTFSEMQMHFNVKLRGSGSMKKDTGDGFKRECLARASENLANG
ncbi:unnamed protein product [Pleuronectes platessa]|uniref:Uncharacterized protein n=1 Tax=Pleuronectes platessa TaxID=8262 RepID=A0A9N7UIW7_PLEPL|nr:unnamed protein product [Pleuronectes platessa]